VVINLFIAVVINKLEAAKADEQGTAALTPGALRADLRAVYDQLTRIESRSPPFNPSVRVSRQ
jgi:hypothetical protein